MLIINLTPHAISICDESKNIVRELKPSGKIARMEIIKKLIEELEGILYLGTKLGVPVLMEGDKELVFPEFKPGVIYVTSSLFRLNYQRKDIWQPGELIRDDEGKVVGCIGLSQ